MHISKRLLAHASVMILTLKVIEQRFFSWIYIEFTNSKWPSVEVALRAIVCSFEFMLLFLFSNSQLPYTVTLSLKTHVFSLKLLKLFIFCIYLFIEFDTSVTVQIGFSDSIWVINYQSWLQFLILSIIMYRNSTIEII